MDLLQLNDLVIDKNNAEHEIPILMKHVEPTWESKDLQIKNMSMGNLSCHLYRCEWSLDPQMAYVVRLFDEETMTPMKNHEFEVKIIKLLSKLTHFPRLAMVFNNGICYEYMDAIPFYVNPPNFEDPSALSVSLNEDKLRLIAEKLAVIHNITVPTENYSQSPYFDNLLSVFDELYPDNETLFPSKESLKKVVNEFRASIEKLHLPKVLCHGDLQLPNIMWIEKKGIVAFLDWEMAHIGYRALDIAYFFMNIVELIEIKKVTLDLPIDYHRKFIVFYLNYGNHLQHLPETEPKETQISDLKKEVDIFTMLVKLFRIGVSVPALRKIPLFVDKYKTYIIQQWWEPVIMNKEKIFENMAS